MLRRLSSALAVVAVLMTAGSKAGHADDPSDRSPILQLMFGSCIQQDRPIPIFRTVLDRHPQLAVFLGDNIYADTSDMDVMRAKYATLAASEEFAALRSACPILATWDDHDYGRNDSGADFPQRRAAEQLFLDFWGDGADSPRRKRPGVYDAHVFGPPGKRLQVILLDTRYFRSPWKTGERRVGGPYIPDSDPDKTLLGEDQWRWLEAQLREPAEVRVIAPARDADGKSFPRRRQLPTIERTLA